MKIFKWLVLLFLLSSCVTIVSRKLPDISQIELKSDKKIKISFNEYTRDGLPEKIISSLNSLGFEKNIMTDFVPSMKYKSNRDSKKFDDFFSERNVFENNSFDVKIEIVWQSYGFFEPYCALFLTAIPCTPPYNWFIGARVYDKNNKFIKDYVIHESGTGMYWFVFLTPDFWTNNYSKYEAFFANAVKTLMLEIKKDGLL